MWNKTPLKSRASAIADAEAAALVATDHAPSLVATDHAPSLVAISATLGMVTLENERARVILQRALALDPNSAWGWMRSGWTWIYLGEPERALADFNRAEELSPRDPFLFNILFGRGVVQAVLGNYDQGVELIKQGLTAGPGVTWAYRELANFSAQAGRLAEADKAVKELVRCYPDLTLKRVADSMPPAFSTRYTGFFEGLRRAGVPDE